MKNIIEFDENNKIIINPNSDNSITEITIICEGEKVKTVSFYDLVYAVSQLG